MRVAVTLCGPLLALFHPLAPAADFAGRISDGDGNPVSGAKVWLTAEDWVETYEPSVLAETVSDQQGQFALVNAPQAPTEPGSYTLCAHKEGWAFAWTDRIRSPNPSVLLVFEKPFPLRGRIVGPDGRPVAGVKPTVSFLIRYPGFDPFEMCDESGVLSPPASISDMMVTAANAAGEFELRHLPPGIQLHVVVEDNRFAHGDARFVWGEADPTVPIEIALQPPGTIRGRISREQDGAPLAGVSVATSPSEATTTDEQGRYQFTNLAPAVYQVYLNELPVEYTAKAVEVTLEAGATIENADLKAIPGIEIQGIVTEQGTGQPIANAGVSCNTEQQPKPGISFPVVHTGPDGRYSLRAPQGPAQVRPFDMPDGWRSAESFGRGMRRFTVSPNEAPVQVDFEVVRARRLEGTVIGADGQPVAGARVVLVSEGDIGFARGATTDAEGGFAYENISPGTRCLLRAYLGESMSPEDHVASPQDRRPIALRLAENVRPNVTGTVVTGGGRPVPYALVRAMCSGAAGPGQPSSQWRTLICNAMADADGRFSMRKLWPGMNYSLRVRAGAYSEESVEVEPLAPGEARDVGDIPLAVADLAVSGRVVDDKGNPVPNVVVDAERVEGHFSRRKMAITDLEGRFTFEALPRESLRLVADRFASNSTYASIGPNHDPRTEVVIKAIPRDKQILFTHELDPPLQGQEANVKATLSRLLRYKSFSPDGEIGHYLGLDFDGPRDPDTGRGLFAWVFDGKRRPLPAARTQAYMGQKNIPGFELPATGSSVLSRVLIGYLHVPASEWPLRIGPLQPQLPFEDRNRAFVLWSVDTTDEWLQPSLPGEPVTPGDPPYLLAHVYAVVSETERYLPAMAQTAPEGLELVPAAAFYYSLEQDTLELPQNLAEMQEALKEEAERALMALVDWGVVLPEPAVIAGYLFQSTGGHGAIAPPEGITVELTPLAYPAVAFDNIPLPEELTAGE